MNKINSLTPELLILCGSHEKMSFFLKEHGCKINAGLCICAEEIVTDAKTHIDGWAHGKGVRKFFVKIGTAISQRIHDFLFQRQMKQEKQHEEADETGEN